MPAKAQSVVQSAKAKSGLGRVLFPSAQTGTGALPKQFRAALTSVLTSPTVGLIPDLIDIIMKYSLSIPLSVHTLAVCTTEKMGRPHYGVLWSATASGKRLADDTVLLVTDYLHHRLKAIDLVSGKITTFAGGGKSELDGTKVLEFRFNNPTGISVHPIDRSIYVTEFSGNAIRRIADGVVTTLCGHVSGGCVDGDRMVGRLRSPFGLAISSRGKFGLIADYNNHRIRRVELNTGTLSTVAAGAEAGSDIGMNNEPLGLCNHPRAIAFDQSTPILDSVAYVCAYDSLLRLNLLTNSMEVMRTGSFEYRPRDVCCFAPNKLLVLSQYGLSVTDTRRRHVYASASDSTGGGDDKLPAIATPAKAVTAAGAAAAAATVVVPYDDVFIVPFQNGVETNGAVADAKFGYMSGLVLLRDDGTVRCGDVDRCYIMDQDHNTVRTITGSICAFELPPSNGMLP